MRVLALGVCQLMEAGGDLRACVKVYTELKDRDDIPLLLEGKKCSFKLVWMESTSPCNSLIGQWPLVEVPLRLIDLSYISSDKNQFSPSRKR
jgi:hypothetical protein